MNKAMAKVSIDYAKIYDDVDETGLPFNQLEGYFASIEDYDNAIYYRDKLWYKVNKTT